MRAGKTISRQTLPATLQPHVSAIAYHDADVKHGTAAAERFSIAVTHRGQGVLLAGLGQIERAACL